MPSPLPCGHNPALAIFHRDGRTAWCFICEADVGADLPSTPAAEGQEP